nr:hypothetical protein [Nostoc commune]
MTRVSLPVIHCAIGGSTMVQSTIRLLIPSCCCAMGVVVTILAIICKSQDLQALVNELGIEIRIAHYPPYTSKYNPIEHRLFPHVTRACQGVIFESVEIVEELIAKTKTKSGLQVFTTILDGVYKTGRKVTEEFKQMMEIVFDDYLPQWNYTAVPQIR